MKTNKRKNLIYKILIASFGIIIFACLFVEFKSPVVYGQEDYDDIKGHMGDDANDPTSYFEFAPGSPEPGQEIHIIQSGQGFADTDVKGMMYTYCAKYKPIGENPGPWISLMGLVGGSDDEFNEDGYLENRYGVFAPLDDNGEEACSGTSWSSATATPGDTHYFTRRWDSTIDGHEDTDGDGMNDLWERQYFRIGLASSDLLPGGPYNSVGDVNPASDIDEDGWNWHDGVYWFDGHMEWTGGNENYNRVWQIGVPYAALTNASGTIIGRYNLGSEGPDNVAYTNAEEYVFGTDPFNADTDNDGVFDEMDVSGRGALQAIMIANGETNDQYEVSGHVMGLSNAWQQGKRADNDRRPRYFLTNTYKKFGVSDGGDLDVFLKVPEYVVNGQAVEIEAIPSNASSDIDGLYYQWFLDGAPVDSASGYGRKYYKFNSNRSVCANAETFNEPYRVAVEISENSTNKMTSAEEVIPIGAPTSMNLELNSNINGGDDLWLDFLNAADDDTRREYMEKGVRYGDIVEVYTSIDDGGACIDFANDLIYTYFVDGIQIIEATGLGGGDGNDNRYFQFNPYRDEDQIDYTNINEKKPPESYLVKFQAIKVENGEIYAKDERTIKLNSPNIELNTPLDTTAGIEGDDVHWEPDINGHYKYAVGTGSLATFTYHIEYFRPTGFENGQDYTYSFNGDNFREDDIVIQPAAGGNRLQFQVPSTGENYMFSDYNSIDNLSITIEGKPLLEDIRREAAFSSQSVNVSDNAEEFFDNTTGFVNKALASITSFLPPQYYTLFKISFTIISLLIIILVIRFMMGETKSSKE
ncbi:MAG: hypothetical protein ABIE68_00425 [bacterium]